MTDAGFFFVAFLSTAALALFSIPVAVPAGDAGELTCAVHYLANAHPPGYPLYVLLGKCFSFLPLSTEVFRLSLFSAVAHGLCAGAAVFAAVRLLKAGNFAEKNRCHRLDRLAFLGPAHVRVVARPGSLPLSSSFDVGFACGVSRPCFTKARLFFLRFVRRASPHDPASFSGVAVVAFFQAALPCAMSAAVAFLFLRGRFRLASFALALAPGSAGGLGGPANRGAVFKRRFAAAIRR